MTSPKFPLRKKDLEAVFARGRLTYIWRKKVRHKLRTQILPDPIEHLDIHTNLENFCQQLHQKLLTGTYVPGAVRRVLMEKSKGLCRQLVVPSSEDALVLQCLSDSLYQDIKWNAPSSSAFFEPEDHSFQKVKDSLLSEPKYGSFRAWLAFQKAVFKFSKEYRFLVVTDIANYYDFISHVHLRNIVAGEIKVRESVLDMLIFVLAGFLWQPDYTPRVEIGLPQIDLDAPRILAHCFLYELDRYLSSIPNTSFVRFMDDIDVGADSIDQAKTIIRDIDLVLQTRQVRLNSGKTRILRSAEAERHFRIRENLVLNLLADTIERKQKKNLSLDRERRHISRAFSLMYRRRAFDDGNGEKILKRMLTMSRHLNAKVSDAIIFDILHLRPSCRSNALHFLTSSGLRPRAIKIVKKFIASAGRIDDYSCLDASIALVEGVAVTRKPSRAQILEILALLDDKNFFELYAKIWIASKYLDPLELLQIVNKSVRVWSVGTLGRRFGLSVLSYCRIGRILENH